MKLRQLKYFEAAAEELNLTRASLKLNISQPAVSRLIRELECELGCTLFVRERFGLRLTAEGEVFLSYVKRILATCGEAARAVKEAASGKMELKVGFITTALASFLGNTLMHLGQGHPEVDVAVYEMPPGDQITELRNGVIDIAFVGNPSGLELRDELDMLVVKEIALNAALPAQHRLSGREMINLKDLAEDTFVGFIEKKFPGRNRTMNEACLSAGFHASFCARAGSLIEALGMIGMGKGVCLMPADVENLPHPNVVFIPLSDHLQPIRLAAIWLTTNHNPAIKFLLEALHTSFPKPSISAT